MTTVRGWAGAYVLAAGVAALLGLALFGGSRLTAPLSLLTGFRPDPSLTDMRLIQVTAAGRLTTMVLVPLIAMRLFVEEKRSGSIAMLLTSPVGDAEIVIGKWMGGMGLYAALWMLSVAALVIAAAWPVAANIAIVLAVQAGAIMAVGESLSALLPQEGAVAVLTLLAGFEMLRWEPSGVLGLQDCALSTALAMAGWMMTGRTLHKIRDAFCG